MCDKTALRDIPPIPPSELYAKSPMNPENKKKRETKEMQFIEDMMR